MKPIRMGKNTILLARVGDNFYAVDNKCPHAEGDLSQGKIEGTIVTCPRHHSQFDLSNGNVVRWTDWTGIKLNAVKVARPPRPLKTYAVKVEGDKVLISHEPIPAAAGQKS